MLFQTDHHAYLTFGYSWDEVRLEAAKYFNELTPIVLRTDVLKVDDVRGLVNQAVRSSEQKRLFVIDTVAMTVSAQNAWLRTIEEPSKGVVFLLMLPRGAAVLPTLLSRVETYTASQMSAHAESSTYVGYKTAIDKALRSESPRRQLLPILDEIVTHWPSKEGMELRRLLLEPQAVPKQIADTLLAVASPRQLS